MPSYVRAGIRKCARIRALSRLFEIIFILILPQMDIYTHFAMADTAQLAKEDKLTEFVDRAFEE